MRTLLFEFYYMWENLKKNVSYMTQTTYNQVYRKRLYAKLQYLYKICMWNIDVLGGTRPQKFMFMPRYESRILHSRDGNTVSQDTSR